MNDLPNIRQIIKNIAEISHPFYNAEVVSVDNQDTCTIKIGNTLTVSVVGITPVSGDDSDTKITVLPAIGSKVTVVDLSEGKMRELQIIKFSQIDSVSAGIGENITIKIADDKLKISSPNMVITVSAMLF